MKNEMYGVLKNVISTKNYELSDMLKKIKTLWAHSDITDEQCTELIQYAQGNARTENSIDVLNKLYELERRVIALEKLNATNEPAEDETETITYPEYETGKWYYNGDKVSVDGQNYTCIAPAGIVCVWSPLEYPAYWELYVTTNDEDSEVETDEPQPEDETIAEDSVGTE